VAKTFLEPNFFFIYSQM